MALSFWTFYNIKMLAQWQQKVKFAFPLNFQAPQEIPMGSGSFHMHDLRWKGQRSMHAESFTKFKGYTPQFPSQCRKITHAFAFDHCVSIPYKSGRALISSRKSRSSSEAGPRSRHLPQSKQPHSLSLRSALRHGVRRVLITHTHTYAHPSTLVPETTPPKLFGAFTLNDPAGNQRLFMLSCLDPLQPTHPPHPTHTYLLTHHHLCLWNSTAQIVSCTHT